MTERKNLPVIPQDVPTHDSTMMSDWCYCRRKYALAHIVHIKRSEIAFPLSFGSLLHKGMDVYYTVLKPNRDVASAAEAALEAMYATDYIDPMDNHRTKARAMRVMAEYVAHYKEDQDFQEILFTETPFNVEQADGFRWGGIIDLWGKYHHRHWPCDHKTTSQFGQYFYEDFKRSPQFLGYQSVGADLHGEEPAGVLINVLVVRKNDTQFDRRPLIFADWLGAECKNMQIQNYHDIYIIRNVLQAELDRGEDLLDLVFQASLFTPNFYNCVGKYGRCAYYDLCDARPENRPRVIDNEYETHLWDWTKERE